jgi:hypothetical protein
VLGALLKWPEPSVRWKVRSGVLRDDYDFLFGLKVMAEIGRVRDPRCEDALDLLESRQLPDGGWPAERRYYSVSKAVKLHADYVDWGGTSTSRLNPWVTADALRVLRSAGRWKP